MRTDPVAAITARDVKFSEAMSWSVVCCRSSSRSSSRWSSRSSAAIRLPLRTRATSEATSSESSAAVASYREGGPPIGSATSSLDEAPSISEWVRSAATLASQSSRDWPRAHGPATSPRRTSSLSVNDRDQAPGSFRTTSRTCSRAMPRMRSAPATSGPDSRRLRWAEMSMPLRLEGGDRLRGGGRSAAEQAGRVDARFDAEPVQPVAEQTLGHRRAADVRRADQEDVDPGSVPAPPRRLRLPGAASPAVTRRFPPP